MFGIKKNNTEDLRAEQEGRVEGPTKEALEAKKAERETKVHQEEVLELLKKWKQAIRVCHKAHIRSAAILIRRHRNLGIPVVILSTIVGTSIFASLSEESSGVFVTVVVGFLSVSAAVLASLQTFLGYSELAEKHKTASQKYGALRREIEEILVTYKAGIALPDDFIGSVRTRWDLIDEESPSLSQKLYDKIAADIWSKEKP